MLITKQDYKKSIPKLLLSLVMLIIMIILIYNNFIKKEKYLFSPSEEAGSQDLYTKFNLDVFEDSVFKNLVKLKRIATPTVDRIGRENPFLKF